MTLLFASPPAFKGDGLGEMSRRFPPEIPPRKHWVRGTGGYKMTILRRPRLLRTFALGFAAHCRRRDLSTPSSRHAVRLKCRRLSPSPGVPIVNRIDTDQSGNSSLPLGHQGKRLAEVAKCHRGVLHQLKGKNVMIFFQFIITQCFTGEKRHDAPPAPPSVLFHAENPSTRPPVLSPTKKKMCQFTERARLCKLYSA